MCPVCIASTAVIVAGAGSTGGILSVCIGKFRKFFRVNHVGLFQQKRKNKMATSKEKDQEHGKGHLAMKTPPIVSQQEWEAARQQLLLKEKALTRSRDALAAERRRMPWLAVDKKYEFDGPKGKVSLLDLFEGRRQLIVYRAFFEPTVFGWPEHACRGCSLGADRGDGDHLELSKHHASRTSGDLGGLAGGLPPDPAIQVVELERKYDAE